MNSYRLYNNFKDCIECMDYHNNYTKTIRTYKNYKKTIRPYNNFKKTIKVKKMKSFFQKLVKMRQYRGTPIIDRLFTNL